MANNSRRSGLLIGGVILALILVIAGLFLPPISLGERLGLTGGGSDTPAATTDAPGTVAVTSADGLALRDVSGDVTVGMVPAAQLAANAEWATAANGLPAGSALKSDVYTFEYEGDAPTGVLAVTVPEAARAEKAVDLYTWNGQAWQFMPSTLDASERVSAETPLPRAAALLKPAPQTARTVAAELLPMQALPDATLPLLTELSVGTVTLAENGALQGEPTSVPFGSYRQFLRATNTGIIVDQVSLVNMLLSPESQDSHVTTLVDRAFSGGYAGVSLDYQGVPVEQQAAFNEFILKLDSALAAQNLDLLVTLATPQQADGEWLTGGQNWSAIGSIADAIYVQMPLDPTAYVDGGPAEQMLDWATGQVDRHKLTLMYTANAIDSVGDSFIEMSNERALQNYGEIVLADGMTEVEPNTAVEASLTGSASPLEWDGASLTYKYSYEQAGQPHSVWLGSESSLTHRMRLADRFGVRGVAVRGMQASDGDRFGEALGSYLGSAEAPQPVAVALLWTVTDPAGSVVASGTGGDLLNFAWSGAADAGEYAINVDFAKGELIVPLDSQIVTVAEPVEEVAEEESDVAAADTEDDAAAEPAEEEEEAPAEEDAGTPTYSPGDADAAINVAANFREGPGLSYPVIRVLDAGTRVELIGRNSGSSWFQVVTPEDEEGWLYADLLNINSSVDRAALPVVQVAPPPVAAPAPGGGGGGAGDNPAPPPVIGPAPITGGFELGGQVAGAPYSTMSYAGMTWVKKQHKFSPGNRGTDVQGVISEAHANGFKILLSIPGQPYPSSIDFNAYTNFLGEVAALPDPPDAIEVWNEQNIDFEWINGQIDPAAYVNNMLAPAYNAIKSRNSSILVVSGAPAPTGVNGAGVMSDDRYMAGMAAAGAANYMDCVGIHFNAGATSPSQSSGHTANSDHYSWYFWPMVNLYHNAFGGSRPLCFTELGYLSGEDYGGVPSRFSWAANTTVAQQAQWLAEAASLAASSGKVRMMIIFNVDFTNYGDDPQAGYAMIRANGSCPACDQLATVMGR